ncbi:hypothetical protein [Nocardioides sp. YIM 152588]|uniref:hypothetical protein n=1 Tax=Nocardioides sp. YIM 152588 TaxID=3158259 RepID=UPI0032E3883E
MKLRNIAIAAATATLAVTGIAGTASAAPTTTPGQSKAKYDQDGNGVPDAGVYVTGSYKSYYGEDANGDYYWDLGDGRVYKSVETPDDLDQATRVDCDYKNTYRADFGNDPFMDQGWIINNINCSDGTAYHFLIVSDEDPRYTGDPDNAIWGTWEYHVNAQSGSGNLANPRLADRLLP